MPSRKKSRRKIRLKRNDFIFLAVCLFVLGGFLCTVFGQEQSLSRIRKEINNNEKEIALKEEEYEILTEEEEKKSGDEHIEDILRKEGYVRENEILYVVGN